MVKDSSGRYSITIPRMQKKDILEFKVTRGDMASAESDEYGDEIPIRKIRFGQRDTVVLNVKGWIDKQNLAIEQTVTIAQELQKIHKK